MKKIAQALFLLATVVLLLINIDLSSLQGNETYNDYFEGRVLTVSEADYVEELGLEDHIQTLEIELLDGPREGEIVTLNNSVNGYTNGKEYVEGDSVVIIEYVDFLDEEHLLVADHVRRPALNLLFALFVSLVLFINRKKGLLSLLSMGFTFLVLFKLVLPLLLLGFNPVFTVLLGSLLILPAIFYLSHGFNRNTHVAMVGTLITLALTGLLAVSFSGMAELTGLATEEAGFLKFGSGENIDFHGLLLAGMIISVLGVLDDVTITQTSVVQQLKSAQKKLNSRELFKRSMVVGRDHIASVVNTLILVYAGTSLPLLLLFIDSPLALSDLLNLEFMAEEIIRTLVGSVGLIMAVPITTLIASRFVDADGHAGQVHPH